MIKVVSKVSKKKISINDFEVIKIHTLNIFNTLYTRIYFKWQYPSELKLLLFFNLSVLPLENYSFPCP